MKALLQRVTFAKVEVSEAEISRIDAGLLVLLGVEQGDNPGDAEWLANKTASLRIFPSDTKEMDRSVVDTDGSALVVSQFTLAADVRKGNRPSFSHAADPKDAQPLCEHYVKVLKTKVKDVQTGVFGANMLVSLVNDGPVTILLQSPS